MTGRPHLPPRCPLASARAGRRVARLRHRESPDGHHRLLGREPPTASAGRVALKRRPSTIGRRWPRRARDRPATASLQPHGIWKLARRIRRGASAASVSMLTESAAGTMPPRHLLDHVGGALLAPTVPESLHPWRPSASAARCRRAVRRRRRQLVIGERRRCAVGVRIPARPSAARCRTGPRRVGRRIMGLPKCSASVVVLLPPWVMTRSTKRHQRGLRQELSTPHVVGQVVLGVLWSLAHDVPVAEFVRERRSSRFMRSTSALPSDPSDR